mmetsp:Transcript_4790/g.10892  ORF Transcript_4790/g.10892 Transcript_4790/m.10892 type:complete len:238 (-) Transcript_4790:482-1195(-)
MSINGTYIEEAKFLKEGAAGNNSTCILVNTLIYLLDTFREQLIQTLGKTTKVLEGLGNDQITRVRTKLTRGLDATGTLRPRGQTNLSIIIQYDNHPTAQISPAIHGLIRHTARDGPIANHGDTVILAFVQNGLCHAHTLSGTDTRGRMPGTERIIFTLLSFTKPTHATQLPQRRKTIPPSRQHFMSITLMCHIPNNIILGHIKHIMQRDSKLRNTQTGTKMSTRFGYGFDDLPSEFV